MEELVSWELETTLEGEVSISSNAMTIRDEPTVRAVEAERIGVFVIRDDLPPPEEMEDDAECMWFIENSHSV